MTDNFQKWLLIPGILTGLSILLFFISAVFPSSGATLGIALLVLICGRFIMPICFFVSIVGVLINIRGRTPWIARQSYIIFHAVFGSVAGILWHSHFRL
jgi:hypothetical protein